MNKFTSGLTNKPMTKVASIHPRVVMGSKNHKKVNTCLPPNQDKKAKLIVALTEHVGRHPHDLQSSNRLEKLAA